MFIHISTGDGSLFSGRQPIQSHHTDDNNVNNILLRKAFRSHFNISINKTSKHDDENVRNITLGEEQIATLLHCDSLNPSAAVKQAMPPSSSPRCQQMLIQSMIPPKWTTSNSDTSDSFEQALGSLEQFYAAVKSPGWACTVRNTMAGTAFRFRCPTSHKSTKYNKNSYKIGIAVVAGGNVNPKAQAASIKNKQDYAIKHGYGIHILTSNSTANKRPIAWAKVAHILSVLSYKYDYVWSLDLDTVILDMNTRLEQASLIDPRFDLVMGVDVNGLNSGSFLIKNTPWSILFLHMLWLQDDVPPLGWWEQSGIHKLFGKNQHFMSNHLKRIPQDAFNMYEGQFVEELASPPNHHDSTTSIPFVIHFAGDGQKWDKVIQYTSVVSKVEKVETFS